MATRFWFSNWQVSGIVTAMSGLPVDIFDPTGGLLYGLFGARPNWRRANARTAKTSVPVGYYFNPSAFSQAMVQPGQPIPSVHDLMAVVDPAAELVPNRQRGPQCSARTQSEQFGFFCGKAIPTELNRRPSSSTPTSSTY